MNQDIDQIKEYYSKISDDMLEYIAKHEANGLSNEVISLIVDEINKRGLSETLKLGIASQQKQLTEEDIVSLISSMKSLSCPVCLSEKSQLTAGFAHRVRSFLVVTNYSNRPTICCHECLEKIQYRELKNSLLLGWWGIPWGFIKTVQVLIRFQYERRNKEHISSIIFNDFVKDNIGEIIANQNNKNEMILFIQSYNNAPK